MGAFETAESCRKWKEEFGLVFSVVPDAEGTLLRRLTNGWVPCNILVGRDGTVIFSENEFDEAGYTRAIAGLYGFSGCDATRRPENTVPVAFIRYCQVEDSAGPLAECMTLPQATMAPGFPPENGP